MKFTRKSRTRELAIATTVCAHQPHLHAGLWRRHTRPRGGRGHRSGRVPRRVAQAYRRAGTYALEARGLGGSPPRRQTERAVLLKVRPEIRGVFVTLLGPPASR